MLEINFKESIDSWSKQFKIDNICDTNPQKRNNSYRFLESNFSSSHTYEYYGNQSDLWLGQNKKNPASYAMMEIVGDLHLCEGFSRRFLSRFYTINVVLKTTPMIKIDDHYYCKNDEIGLEINAKFQWAKCGEISLGVPRRND